MGGMCRIAHDKSIACSTPVFKIQRAKVCQNILRQHALLGQARRAPVGREAVQINAAHGCLRRGQALRGQPGNHPGQHIAAAG